MWAEVRFRCTKLAERMQAGTKRCLHIHYITKIIGTPAFTHTCPFNRSQPNSDFHAKDDQIFFKSNPGILTTPSFIEGGVLCRTVGGDTIGM